MKINISKALAVLDRIIITLCTIGIFAIPDSLDMNPSMTIGQAVIWSISLFAVGLACGCYGLQELFYIAEEIIHICFMAIKKCLSAVVKPNKHKRKYTTKL